MKNVDLNLLIAPEHYNIANEIDQHFSEKEALVWENELGEQQTVKYSELIKRANKLANGLTSLGLKKGDCIVVMTTRLIESYVIYLACLKAGIIISPSSELLRAKDLVYRLNHSEAKAVITYHQFVTEFENIEEATPYLQFRITFGQEVPGWLSMENLIDVEPETFTTADTVKDDYAFLAYTSGTTGMPKGVVHSHGWGFAHLRIAASKWLNIGEADTVWATAAPGWQKWVWSPLLSILGSGATGFVYNGKFQPHKYLQLLQDKKINVLCCTPTEYRMMAKLDEISTFDLSHLHTAVSAGEALNREVIDVFKNHFDIQIRDGYGQTESTLLIANLNVDVSKIGSMGQPLLKEFIEIVDTNGVPVSVNEVGTIAVRKDFPALFELYYKDSEKTANTYHGNYFLTGDRASKDEDNYFWFQGRNDDVIISSGYTIGPFEVEDALMKHESVQECAVVAYPDPIRGNVVKAFVVVKSGVVGTEELINDLKQFVKKLTAPYKYPRIIQFVESLPKTDSGKIRRIELRNS
ncbi:AMP-binding protein [Neobacillus sp. PS3-40]|uniref:acyl-CoA synthetase n=1 Tax=Neobacillus sp. PS3-40 TaxID=3070679 RepID=UPI0027E00815|nr:AMP-binding protein [Neobacillus sp. PS3-40]WML43994.1 AMP-binding protein [Neobacillus sp. PS3-40]